MAGDDRLYQLALYLTPSIGDFNIRQLISYCGSAKKVFETPEGKLLKIPGVGAKTTQILKKKSTIDEAKLELEKIDKEGIDLLFFTDPHYPTKLKHIPDGPAVLYFKGNKASLQSSFNLAIVGSRNATEYGRTITEELIKNIAGKDIMIVAHGNSLRALVKHLDKVSNEDIIGLDIPTGIPLVYELDQNLIPIKHYYLGDQEKISAKIKSVANQGKSR